ncbi:MAG: hypothetical protein RLZZ224_579, partial [Verrucomicrobiota bacterium]
MVRRPAFASVTVKLIDAALGVVTGDAWNRTFLV